MKKGDRIVWHRGAGDVGATVLEVSNDGKKVNLKVDGWLGTTWEALDHTIVLEK